jgi:anaerobic selenocysteine-containing dehydrogenase
MKIERRDFLKLIGGLSGAVVVGGAGFAAVDQVLDVPDEILRKVRTGQGIESWKSTVCGQCPGGCGIRVRLIDSIPVYIKGNPLHPVNQGGMCPLGHGALDLLFNPDRLKGPVRRIGSVSSAEWEPTDWQSALEQISLRLSDLRSSGRSHQVAFLGGSEHGVMQDHVVRFMQAFGSPNYYQVPRQYSSETAYRLTTGKGREGAPDLAHANLVVSFGSNFLEEGHSPVYYTKLFSRLRDGLDRGRARFIQIEPRMSLTAANADQWVPIQPGTYGALALGIAHVLIREDLYDADFVKNRTFGFESWIDSDGVEHTGYKDIVLSEYYPERVSEITGVPSRTILSVARDVGITRPSVILTGEGVAGTSGGTYAQMAVLSLNALLGNFGRPGGIVFHEPPPLAEPDTAEFDALALAGNQSEPLVRGLPGSLPVRDYSFGDLAERLRTAEPYPIEILFLYRSNPIFSLPGHTDLREALERIPMVVSFDYFISETSEFADFILPEHTFLEAWDVVSDVPSVAFSHVGLRQPVIDPVYDTRHTGDVLIDLAEHLGGSVHEAFEDSSYEGLVRSRLRGVYESGQGAIASPGLRDSWLEFMRQRGWQIGRYSSFESFWSELLDQGAWWNPIRDEADLSNLFETSSGKYEFYARSLAEYSAGEDVDFLPHHEEVQLTDETGLRLISFEMLPNRGGSAANQPSMQEMFGYQTRNYWRTWVELNPSTADEFGISDEDWVWL